MKVKREEERSEIKGGEKEIREGRDAKDGGVEHIGNNVISISRALFSLSAPGVSVEGR